MIDWRHWHNEPYLIGGLILLGWLYALVTGPLRGRFAGPDGIVPPYPRAQARKYYAALVVFYLAVGSPLDQAGERFLLSAHMVQHQLIIYPAAVLFLLGLPSWLVHPVTGRRTLRPLLTVLTNPLVCAAVYTITLSVWHMPRLYEQALEYRPVHIAEHVMFFGAALFYWWPLYSPSSELPPRSPAVQMLYLLAVIIAMTPLFAWLAFSDNVLYPMYEFAPRLITDFTPQDDQFLAATIMKLGGMLVAFVATAVAFARWHRPENRSFPT
ncbi:MAG: cytochrome c oxidase assembly protein [Verrucomicrobiota bacterium]